MHGPGPVVPMSGITNMKATMHPPTVPITPAQPAGHYDLSSLKQGMFAKR